MTATLTARLRAALIAIAVLSVASCAGPTTQRIEVDPAAAAREAEIQKEVYVRTNLRDQNRVQDLAFPLLTKSVPICGDDLRPAVGFLALNREAWPKDYQPAAAAALGLTDRLTIVNVIPDSPAASAGFMVGDQLLTIADAEIPTGSKAVDKYEKLTRKLLKVGRPTTFRVDRKGSTVPVDVIPIVACNYYVALISDDQVNAFADGDNIYITSGMLRFAEADTEVSTVLGHELAHNAMGHSGKQLGNQLLGTIFDVVAAAYGVNTQGAFGNAAASAYSQDFEAEADYVGLYALALSGASINEAPDFWRRMGANTPDSIKTTFGGTHPGSAERYLALDATVKEIQTKQASGLPLTPNMKGEGEKD